MRLAAVGVALAALAGTIGWQTPYLVERWSRPSYLGADAQTVARDLDCTQFQRSTNQDRSVYKYRDQGTCLLDNVRVTVTTFDSTADGEAFLTLMNGLIPVVHPTWVGAATAAGEGWNVADTKNLSPQVAETAVRRLGAGEVRVIPSAKRS
ncbi:MAG TPA: hypothetical protein VNV66_16705 [Pilimelia sp.]|nr:hypothetical protein [Pilimelia sp.]